MRKDQLEKGQKIVEQINHCEINIKRTDYTQQNNVVIRKSYLTFNGIDEPIELPESLFRKVGKLIRAEYLKKLAELEAELKKV